MAQINEYIKKLVRGLFEDKQALKELDDSVTKDSAELKKWMLEKNADQFDVGSIHVTCSPQVRSTMDEGKVIGILRNLIDTAKTDEESDRISNCIRTKEYVDEDELERLIYDEIIDKSVLEPAMQSKTVFVLKMRENKPKE